MDTVLFIETISKFVFNISGIFGAVPLIGSADETG